MKRVFEITAFRNLGFKDGKPCASHLVLSNSTKQGKMGELLVLVGANNTGKSNVLDALETYENKGYQETDISYMFHEHECREPALTMAYTNNGENKEYLYTLNSHGNNEIDFPGYEKEELPEEFEDFCNMFHNLLTLSGIEEKLTKDSWGDTLLIRCNKEQFRTLEHRVISNIISQIGENSHIFTEAIEQFKKQVSHINSSLINQIINQTGNLEDKYFGDYKRKDQEYKKLIKQLALKDEELKNQAYKEFLESCMKLLPKDRITHIHLYEDISDILKTYSVYWKDFYFQVDPSILRCFENKINCQRSYDKLEEVFREKLGFYGFKKVVRYRQDNINSTLFQTDQSNVQYNPFYHSLFNSIQEKLNILQNCYVDFHRYNMPAFLKKLEESLNEKLKGIADRFNSLYKTSDLSYSFILELERGGIYFTILKGDKPQVLEQQSTGFRYFFDLFFNLLCTTQLERGTILIMDEPATTLHVKGQRELRSFLKEFALRNDITIIVATHSPFFVDLDNLDELRLVVSNNDGTSRIVNDFTAVDLTDPDTLQPIKEALTVENYMLVNPRETVVFVSTLAEYNLLVAFKKLLRKEGISFLPFNLDGADQQTCIETSKGLQKIRSDAFVLLPDNEAGQLMKSVNGADTEGNSTSDLGVIFWNEIDPAFGTVNSLLSQADQNQLFPKGIDSSSTSVFKNHILEYEAQISEETRENFQKLFHRFD